MKHNLLTPSKIKRSVAISIALGLILFSTQSYSQVVPQFTTQIKLNGCNIATYKMTDVSTSGGSLLVQNNWDYQWAYGNGTAASVWHKGDGATYYAPEASYGLPGVYTVTMRIRVTNTTSPVYTATQQIIVYQSTIPDFIADKREGCVPFKVNFSDLTDTAGVLIGHFETWEWNFGDGTMAYTQNASHTYMRAGFFQVTLTVTTYAGGLTGEVCTGVTRRSNYITVRHSPDAGFKINNSPICSVPSNVEFTDTSTITTTPAPAGVIDATKTKWTFYDTDQTTVIGTATGSSAIRTYTAFGVYPVRLSVMSLDGCADTVTKLKGVEITTSLADFNTNPGTYCAGSTVPFFDASSSSNNLVTATKWAWDFGDGTTSALQNPTHDFATGGTYTVRLTTTFSSNCTNTITHPITILATPNADFTVTPDQGLCKIPLTLAFNPLSNSVGSTHYWNFDDPGGAFGGERFTATPSYTFNLYDNYNIYHRVIDANGCSSFINKNMPIQPPDASFTITPEAGNCPRTFEFNSTSTSVNDGINRYDWSFDGATWSNNQGSQVIHTYSTTGQYTVKLRVETIHGCADTLVLINSVQVGLTPNITDINFAAPTAGHYCRLDALENGVVMTPVFGAGAIPDSVTWDFGDATTATDGVTPFDINHIFEATGTLPVIVSAFSNGCKADFTKSISIL